MNSDNMIIGRRHVALSLKRGLLCQCPNCGTGSLFKSYLKVTPTCVVCHESYSAHRADDLPAYLVLFVVGHIVVGLLMTAESNTNWPIWAHVLIWPLLTLILSLALLQPFKGAIVGLQWALKMHGFSVEAHPHFEDGSQSKNDLPQ
jgi:uncharacterized protein (DUF983 family)